MDNIKTNIAKRVEKILNVLNEVYITQPTNYKLRYDLLSRLYMQLKPEMERVKDPVLKSGTIELHEDLDAKSLDELNQLLKGKRRTQFIEFSNLWEQKLLEFYQSAFKDVEFISGDTY